MPISKCECAVLTLCGVLTASCVANDSIQQRRAGHEQIALAAESIRGRDCTGARAHLKKLSEVDPIYRAPYLKAFVEESCGDWRQAMEVLLREETPLGVEDYRAVDALRILDENDPSKAERTAYLYRVLRIVGKPTSNRIARFSIYHELWGGSPSMMNDYGWQSWLFFNSKSFSATSYNGAALSPLNPEVSSLAHESLQRWLNDRAKWISSKEELKRRLHGTAERRLQLLKIANAYRVKDWLEACNNHMVSLVDGYRIEGTGEPWTCDKDVHCLTAGDYTDRGFHVVTASPVVMWPSGGDVGTDSADVYADGPRNYFYFAVARKTGATWYPEKVVIPGYFYEELVEADVSVEPMDSANCSVEYWRTEYAGPRSTPFSDWYETEIASGRAPPWEPKLNLTFGVFRCLSSDKDFVTWWRKKDECRESEWL